MPEGSADERQASNVRALGDRPPGNDLLCGGRGNHTLTGGQGADRFSGGLGADTVTDLTPSQSDSRDGTIP
jgi:hypothetical protein